MIVFDKLSTSHHEPMRHSSRSISVAVLIVSAGCSSHDTDHNTDDDGARMSMPSTSTAVPDSLATGEVRIVTADSGVDLMLVRDSISGGLSEATLAKIRQSVDTTSVKSTGIGASIEKLVKSTVTSAVGTRVVVPLSAVKDVRYEEGRLQFDWNGKPTKIFDNTKVNGKPVMESFRPDDARRFVDAVRARKRALAAVPLAQ